MSLLMPAFEEAISARDYQKTESDDKEIEPACLPLLSLKNPPGYNLGFPELDECQGVSQPVLPNLFATARGEALHQMLELLHDHETEYMDNDWFLLHQDMLVSLLHRSGLTLKQAQEELPKLQQMIKNALQETMELAPIQSNKCTESHAELVLYQRNDCRLSKHIIDRLYKTGSDEWTLVDYKTGESGEGVLPHWQEQLGRYSALINTTIGPKALDRKIFQVEEDRIYSVED